MRPAERGGIEARFVSSGAVEGGGALGRVVFGAVSGAPRLEDGVPTLPLHMIDDARDAFAEVWRTAGETRCGRENGLVYGHDDSLLFCAGFIPAGAGYTETARQTYADAFALVRTLGFPTIFRMWNYIPDINGETPDGLEVYRDFCRGRALAFEAEDAGHAGMPAATGIGTWGEGVGFYLLACRDDAAQHIENTRQMPAYRYPERYGPKPPSFARATYRHGALYVSGTASIVGHETLHAGDLLKQWEVATDNVAHLVSAGNLAAHGVSDGYTLQDLDQIKVYYRRAEALPQVMQLARAAFHPRAEVRFLNVDICRTDLLVEIEGIARRRGSQ
ncbi:FkbO/Hyg5 family chorismatase [Caballeronia sp. LZ043]|uniref:FkbO/Hyg5 family chorismatase n=1 Tax=Caballeronia sp. LZ043 TaxID=3038569 RepID=UPI002857DA0B|nr:FkbO/Hyg5 family chorismatase [Caballeronia sp. LZ043]MDR5821930.1 FkbO/Hyg5 family chorismatase [Caballeronia sp. LZ043]